MFRLEVETQPTSITSQGRLCGYGGVTNTGLATLSFQSWQSCRGHDSLLKESCSTVTCTRSSSLWSSNLEEAQSLLLGRQVCARRGRGWHIKTLAEATSPRAVNASQV